MSDEKKKNEYGADNLQHLSDREHVRKRPGMYIGDTFNRGLHHLVYEVVDNSIDEAMADYASLISVVINPDGSITVEDNGRGIPVEKHDALTEEFDREVSTLEGVMTVLKFGGKFDKGAYQTSGGLHGVGVSVVNALSSDLEVLIRRDAKVYRITFSNGEKKTDLKAVDTCGKRNTGTTLTFTPNEQYFDSVKFSVTRLRHVLRAKAVLCPGLRVKFKDEKKKETEEYLSE